MTPLRFLFLLLLAAPLAAQNTIPAGTVVAARLDTGMNTAKLHPNQAIRATIMQTVPGTPVRRGNHLVGHILSVSPTEVTLRFDTVLARGRRIPVTANLRAVASMFLVSEAHIPEGAPARGLPPEQWTTSQIGGDQVYRGGGPVTSHGEVVGKPAAFGVRVRLAAAGPCRAALDGNTQPQSLWLFSSDACGVYGIPGLSIRHAGRTTPAGTIGLTTTTGHILIRSGSGWLLRVQGS